MLKCDKAGYLGLVRLTLNIILWNYGIPNTLLQLINS